MTALRLDMTIPVGDAGHVHLLIDIGDITRLTAGQREVLAATGREFWDFGAAVLAPAEPGPPPATVHDPDGGVLAGVTGSRIRKDL